MVLLIKLFRSPDALAISPPFVASAPAPAAPTTAPRGSVRIRPAAPPAIAAAPITLSEVDDRPFGALTKHALEMEFEAVPSSSSKTAVATRLSGSIGAEGGGLLNDILLSLFQLRL
jgi:hypothetical protein